MNPSTRLIWAPERAGGISRFLEWAVAVYVLAAAGCSGAPSPALPEELLGRWYYTGSSGGLTGDGLGDAASGFIVLRADGTIDRHQEDGTLAETIRSTPGRGGTIFSEDDLWILHPESGVPQVIQPSADGRTMTLSENVYDGWSRAYARSR